MKNRCKCGSHSSRLVTNAKKRPHKRRVSPFKMDPTRTLRVREQFIAEIKRRFRKLKDSLWEFLVTQDALGLKKSPMVDGFIFNAIPREYQFLTDEQKLAQFSLWLQAQIATEVVGEGTDRWTKKYVESAYKKGLLNAFLASRSSLDPDDPKYIDATQEAFLRDAFFAPERVSKVQLLATRSFEQLKGVTAQMGSQLNTILAQGMIDGRGVTSIAKDMLDRIDTLSNSRALTIARTEVIHAHAEGQLDGFSDLGVEELGVEAEWSTAGDDRVCPECESMEGKVYSIEEGRGMIPAHPNCRCTWIPYIPKSLLA